MKTLLAPTVLLIAMLAALFLWWAATYHLATFNRSVAGIAVVGATLSLFRAFRKRG